MWLGNLDEVVKDLHAERRDDGSRRRVQQAGQRLRCAPAHPRHHADDRCGGHPGAPGVGPRLRRRARTSRHDPGHRHAHLVRRPQRGRSDHQGHLLRRSGGAWVSPSSCSSATPSSSWPCTRAGVTSGRRASADRPASRWQPRRPPDTPGVVLCPRPTGAALLVTAPDPSSDACEAGGSLAAARRPLRPGVVVGIERLLGRAQSLRDMLEVDADARPGGRTAAHGIDQDVRRLEVRRRLRVTRPSSAPGPPAHPPGVPPGRSR